MENPIKMSLYAINLGTGYNECFISGTHLQENSKIDSHKMYDCVKKHKKNSQLNHQEITRIRSQIIVWFVSAQHMLIVLFRTGKNFVIILSSYIKNKREKIDKGWPTTPLFAFFYCFTGAKDPMSPDVDTDRYTNFLQPSQFKSKELHSSITYNVKLLGSGLLSTGLYLHSFK